MSIRLNYQAAALRVCIDKIENSRFYGRIVGQRLSSPILFTDINNFLVQVDALLDAQKYPKAFQRIRSFTDKSLPEVPAVQTKEELRAAEEVEAVFGAVTTFSLHIFYRQNSTWQGSIDWLDGTEKQQFNSTLEFLKFVDDRLQLYYQ